MKTKYFMILAVLGLLALTGCNWTFTEYRQETYGTQNGEEFTLFLNASPASPSAPNKTLAVGLRLPDGCSFVSGWYNDSNTIDSGNLTESAYITSRLNDSVCPARTGYSWVGLIGVEFATADASWNFGEVNIACNVSGNFLLDIGLEAIDDGFAYSCNNSFEVWYDTAPDCSGYPSIFSGSGSIADPYLVADLTDLQCMNSDLTGNYSITADIDATDTANWNYNGTIYEGFAPIGSVTSNFYGNLEGNNHTISDLYINLPNTSMVGLIGRDNTAGTQYIRDLGLEDVNITADFYAGSIGGWIFGHVDKCWATGTVNGFQSGGLIGHAFNVTNSYADVHVIGNDGGGFVFKNSGIIENCYSAGLVEGIDSAGFVFNSAGFGGDDLIINCFWDNETSGQSVGCEDGCTADLTNVTGKTTADMKLVATFTDTATEGLDTAWDFVNNPNNDIANEDIWAIGTLNNGYPYIFGFCEPSWSCTGYGSCNISDLAPCDTVVDSNSCEQNYTGDYSEFSPQSCDYCAYDLDLLVLGACDVDAGIRSDLYEDLNFATCCNITLQVSDCAFGNETQGYINNSCTTNYQSEYESSDIAKVVIDFIVTWGIAIIALIGVVALVILFRYVRGNVKK